MSYSSTVLSDNPIRYYRLGETSGTVATDIGSQARNGTYTGGYTLNQSPLIAGDTNHSVLFDGTSGYVSLPTTSLPTGSANWSLEGWIKITGAPGTNPSIIVLFGNWGTSAAVAALGLRTTKVGDATDFGTDAIGTTVLSLNTPHHLVATYDGTTMRLYVDGNLDASTTVTPAITLSESNIGQGNGGNYLAAYIQEVAIYSTVLSATRVSAHYQAGITTGLVVTVAGTSYTAKDDNSFKIRDRQNERSQYDFTLTDTTGTATFSKGQKVVVTDSTLGTLFTGVIHTAKPLNLIPQPYVDWSINCTDLHYDADKRTINKNYTNQYAGTITMDMHAKVLAAEGITSNSSYRLDTTNTDFNAGTLTSVVGTLNVGDGDLELAMAGSTVNISQGPITFPSTSAIKMTGVMSAANLPSTITPQVQMEIWSGAYTIVSGDVFTFDVWIDGSSVQQIAGVDFVCTDGTQFSALGGSYTDIQFLGPIVNNQGGLLDLTGLAVNTWYTRQFQIGASGIAGGVLGKTIQYVSVAFYGAKPGNYTAYFRNVSITNGATTKVSIFGPSASVFQTSPQIIQNIGYAVAAASIVTAYNQSGSVTTSPVSIAAASIARSSFLSWIQTTPVNETLSVAASVDGGITYLPCTNNSAIPGLLPGMNLSGKTLTLTYAFANKGGDPTVIPQFTSVSGNVQPSYVATKSDIIYSINTQAGWNTGTLTNLTAPGGNVLQLSGYARNWDDANFSNQTLFGTDTVNGGQLVQVKTFKLSEITSSADIRSRFDFAGSNWQNFTAEMDVQIGASGDQSCLIYRTTGWINGANSFAYLVFVTNTSIEIGRGTNGGGTTYTTIANAALSLTLGNWYHLKVIVNGNSHKVYLNDVLYLNATDSTYPSAGYVGVRYLNNAVSSPVGDIFFDNFGVVSALSGTWVSPPIDIHSLGTIQGSEIIAQIDSSNAPTTSILLEISLNNGSTWATCTNGQTVPGLTNGTNVSAMTQVLIRVTISTTSASTGAAMPDIQGITLLVMGAYSSSGNRITAPLGNDTMVRANQSGWGTAFDGQSWVKTGTGTDAISSNEATITNTTGDVHEVLGSQIGSDLDGTVRFQLSASTISAGMELRYQDANNFYRFSASTTMLTLLKVSGGVSYTLATAAMTLTTGTYYRMRFRVVGSGYTAPVSLSGKVWADGTLEPLAWSITGTD